MDAPHAPVVATLAGLPSLLQRIAIDDTTATIAQLCQQLPAQDLDARLRTALAMLDPRRQAQAVHALVHGLIAQPTPRPALWAALCGGWHDASDELAMDLHAVLGAVIERAALPPGAGFDALLARFATLDEEDRAALLPQLLRAHVGTGTATAHAAQLRLLVTGLSPQWISQSLVTLWCDAPMLSQPADFSAAITQLPHSKAPVPVVEGFARALQPIDPNGAPDAGRLDALVKRLATERRLRPHLAVLLRSPIGAHAARAMTGPVLDDDTFGAAASASGVTGAWLAAARRGGLPMDLLFDRLVRVGRSSVDGVRALIDALSATEPSELRHWHALALLAGTLPCGSDGVAEITARVIDALDQREPLPEDLAWQRDDLVERCGRDGGVDFLLHRLRDGGWGRRDPDAWHQLWTAHRAQIVERPAQHAEVIRAILCPDPTLLPPPAGVIAELLAGLAGAQVLTLAPQYLSDEDAASIEVLRWMLAQHASVQVLFAAAGPALKLLAAITHDDAQLFARLPAPDHLLPSAQAASILCRHAHELLAAPGLSPAAGAATAHWMAQFTGDTLVAAALRLATGTFGAEGLSPALLTASPARRQAAIARLVDAAKALPPRAPLLRELTLQALRNDDGSLQLDRHDEVGKLRAELVAAAPAIHWDRFHGGHGVPVLVALELPTPTELAVRDLMSCLHAALAALVGRSHCDAAHGAEIASVLNAHLLPLMAAMLGPMPAGPVADLVERLPARTRS